MSTSSGSPPAGGDQAPAPLQVAAALAGLEGVLLALYGLSLLPSTHGERLAVGLTAAAFCLIYGVFLVVCAWQVYRLHSWARAPIVLAQALQILVGASFWGGGTTAVAVVLVLVGLLCLAGIFHRASIVALADELPH